jgi:hypothetical protein
MPERLDDEELADWRAGRDAGLTESGSQSTLCCREMDSNFRFRAR